MPLTERLSKRTVSSTNNRSLGSSNGNALRLEIAVGGPSASTIVSNDGIPTNSRNGTRRSDDDFDPNAKGIKRNKRRKRYFSLHRILARIPASAPVLSCVLWKLDGNVRAFKSTFHNWREWKWQVRPGCFMLIVIWMLLVCFGAMLIIAIMLGLSFQFWKSSNSDRYHSTNNIPRSSASLGRFQQRPHVFFADGNYPKRTFDTTNSAGRKKNHMSILSDLPILIHQFQPNDENNEYNFELPPEMQVSSYNPDYGGLQLTFLNGNGIENGNGNGNGNEKQQYQRRIPQPDFEAMQGHVWEEQDYEENFWRWDNYHSFDDEYLRNDQFRETNLQCRYTAWHRNMYPTCNNFHEVELIKGKNRLLGRGAYRAAFLQHEPYDRDLVVKVQCYDDNNPFDVDRFEFVRMDAIIMERLTASPRIADIYGHCASSIYSEYLPSEVEGKVVPGDGDGVRPLLQDKEDVDPKNNYSISEKLDLALMMAEALADLHGFRDGVIVHDDVQLAQFLFRPDGRLVLNDFNRGEAMLFDEGRGQFCKYKNGKGGGTYRAPEEYKDAPLNEKIDVWSFGNSIYALLTGLWVFYHTDEEVKEIMQKMIDGELAYVDKRYLGRNYIQDKLIELMYRCWVYDPDDRADIFEAVATLRNIVKEGKKLGIYDGRF